MASRNPGLGRVERDTTRFTIAPSAYLRRELEAIRTTHGVPALAAVLVRDGGNTVVGTAVGERKADLSATASANIVQQADRFCIGSVSKPFTGYLIARLVERRADFAWSTRIRDVFPEFDSPAFRARYGILSAYLDKTVEQLMTHNADLPYAPANGFEMRVSRTDLTDAFRREYASADSLAVRRYNYVITSLQDKPVRMKGIDITYGGGVIIAAAMAERLTGKPYEQLLEDEVFTPLSMTNSGLGRLATNATPDGIWEHNSNPTTGAITPDANATAEVENFHSHAPAGAVHTTHADMAKFIIANLSESGKSKSVVSDSMLRQAHAQPDATESRYTRGGWARNGAGDNAYIHHNGDNCRSRAELIVRPAQNRGHAAMTNVANGCTEGQKHIGAEAVNAAMALLEDMHDRWETLFG